MKKRILPILLVVALSVALVLTLTACGSGPSVKEAYGLVHGNGYIGKAFLIYEGDTLTHAFLDEAELPQSLYQDAEIANVTVKGTRIYSGAAQEKHFFKTVKWGSHTATFDPTTTTVNNIAGISKGYSVDGTPIVEFFADEKNCEEFFNAVLNDEVQVLKTDGSEYTLTGGVKPMGADEALKTRNDYWGSKAGTGTTAYEPYSAAPSLGWAQNARATCAWFVMNSGSFVKADITRDSTTRQIKVKGNVVAGASWTDAADYLLLLQAAANK